MLARTSTLIHKPSGVSLETPILIPSFSSKGFKCDVKRPEHSEVRKLFALAAEFLHRTCLVSAYDVHYGFLPTPGEFPVKPELIFVDSGGYEISDFDDLSTVYRPTTIAQEWTLDHLKAVMAQWPGELPAAFVSFDHPKHRKPLMDQVKDARRLFVGRQEHLTSLLIKPETDSQLTLKEALASARANSSELKSFDIVGVTEKELGSSVLEKMVALSRLRQEMDAVGVTAPIHVFGALDPLSICLYFIAGAEIFDGLTWLRFAYSSDRCLYVQDAGALEFGIHTRNNDIRARTVANNAYYLEALEHSLRDFQDSGDFGKLPHADFMKASSERLDRALHARRS